MPARLPTILAAGLARPGRPDARAADPFVVKPYLQLGDAPASNAGDLVLLWQADDVDADWSVEYRPAPTAPGRRPRPAVRRGSPWRASPPHRVYRATLAGLAPGVEFAYRVRKGGDVVFESAGEGPEVGRPAVPVRGRRRHRAGDRPSRRRWPTGWSRRSPTS